MSDVHSPEIRSKNMRAIRASDTKPEMIVRKALHAAGYRYRLRGAGLPGRPDLVLSKYRTAVFVHGCFWHGHNCRYFKVPQTRTDFWMSKIKANKLRDLTAIARLSQLGWHVIVIWECATRPDGLKASELVQRVSTFLGAHPPKSTPDIVEIPS